ncbi:MAG: DUF2306 domain-containing protein [Gemmatimonadetes bacterium]|nr:DUF2306 domain-containing protein [Gemmatimonadota bacterium]
MIRANRRTIAWWIVVALGWLVALYALATAALGAKVYPPDLRDAFLARPWAITSHAFFGAIAMLIGPWQFRRGPGWNRRRHRWVGRGYLVACLLSGVAGLFMAFYSFGGLVTHLGFGLLAIGLLTTTGAAYWSIRAKRVAEHRAWMIRSYALIFAAVTLRIELPVLTATLQGFEPAYRIIAWLCWVPNLLAAEWYLRSAATRPSDPLPEAR